MYLSYLIERAGGQHCELCGKTPANEAVLIAPKAGTSQDDYVLMCDSCAREFNDMESIEDLNRWRFLGESIWSTVPAAQVASYRMLKYLEDQPWAADILSMAYLDEPTMEWAQSLQSSSADMSHLDAHGQKLSAGDTVTLIKDLQVKGASFTAKRGTAVRKIRLVPDHFDQIEGKVEGQQIVILTQYVKKN